MNLLNGLFLGAVAAVAVYGLVVLLDYACDLEESIEERAERDVTEAMAEDYRWEAKQKYNHE
jgi:hypothetical protein